MWTFKTLVGVDPRHTHGPELNFLETAIMGVQCDASVHFWARTYHDVGLKTYALRYSPVMRFQG